MFCGQCCEKELPARRRSRDRRATAKPSLDAPTRPAQSAGLVGFWGSKKNPLTRRKRFGILYPESEVRTLAAAGAFQIATLRSGSEAALKRVIVEKRNAGWQWTEIADDYDVSTVTLRAWCKRLAITETTKAE